MLGLMGLLVIGVIVALLISGKTSPIVAMTAIPIIGALLIGFNLEEINSFFIEGTQKIFPVAIMFVFAIIFFGIMKDAGLFDPLVNKIIQLTKGNVVVIAIGTALVAVLTHLDGAAATTLLITIPAFLPVYKKMHMSPNLLLLIVAMSVGVMNILPWGGPIGRVAAVKDLDLVGLWQPLIPLQIISFFVLLTFAGMLGWREKKRIDRALSNGTLPSNYNVEPSKDDDESISKKVPNELNRKMFLANSIIFIGILVLLLGGFTEPGLAFMIGLAIALPLNFRNANKQMEIIKTHAPDALMMAAILIAAGSFLGVLSGTGMLDAFAKGVVIVMPDGLIPSLHLIIGTIGVLTDVVISTDAYYFALYPLVDQIVSPYGVEESSIIYSMLIPNNFGGVISPVGAPTWLGVGLAGVTMGSHIRYSLFWMWLFGFILLILAVLLGLIII